MSVLKTADSCEATAVAMATLQEATAATQMATRMAVAMANLRMATEVEDIAVAVALVEPVVTRCRILEPA